MVLATYVHLVIILILYCNSYIQARAIYFVDFVKARWTTYDYENLFRVLIWHTQLEIYWTKTSPTSSDCIFRQEMDITKQCNIAGISFTINDDCMQRFQSDVSS